MSNVVLISGLKVDVDGMSDDKGRETIETNQNRQQIENNAKDIAENTNRFTALNEYDVKGEATVKFNVGSSNLSAKDQEDLKQLAQTATGLNGYIIEETGYADSTGSAAMNTKLSEDRAKARWSLT